MASITPKHEWQSDAMERGRRMARLAIDTTNSPEAEDALFDLGLQREQDFDNGANGWFTAGWDAEYERKV